jgi:biopolymer transport protein ExbD
MRFPRNAKIFKGQWDVLPFAGVFLLLPLLLLITLRQTFTSGIHVRVPEVDAELRGTFGAVAMVVLAADGRMFFENQVYLNDDLLLANLRRRAEAGPGELTLVIRADQAVRYDRVAMLQSLHRKLGFADCITQVQHPGRIESGSAAKSAAP